jgi:hypothetical protein
MEKCIAEDLWLNIFEDAHKQKRCAIDLSANEEITDQASDESLPRAIIEACVDALSTGDSE